MMKTILLCTIVLLAGAWVLRPAGDQHQADEEAIQRVLLAETDYFFARDYEGWASTFAKEPNAIQVWNNGDGSYTNRMGWETISESVKAFMDNNPEPDKTPLHRENFSFRHYGNAAFVTFDKYMGDRVAARPIKEIRVVEKKGDEWKIVCVAAFINYVEA